MIKSSAIALAILAISVAAQAASVYVPPSCDETRQTCTVPVDPSDPYTVDSQNCHSTVRRYLQDDGPQAGMYCRVRTCTHYGAPGTAPVTKDYPVDCVAPAIKP